MIPREIFHHALPCREAHPFHDCRMIIELLNRRRERIDIRRRDDYSLDAVLDYVARFACRDLRETTSRRLVSDFGAAFALRGKNMNGRRAQIFFGFARKADHFHALVREFLQERLHLGMDGADEPEFRIFKIEPVPGLEQMMDSLALDERPGKD